MWQTVFSILFFILFSLVMSSILINRWIRFKTDHHIYEKIQFCPTLSVSWAMKATKYYQTGVIN